MVSDEKLASLAVPPTPAQEKSFRHAIGEDEAADHALCHLRDVAEMAQELLAYREAERKANSWDDAPEWALSRQRVTETFCYTDALPGMYQGNARRSYLSREAMGKVEERPK